MSTHQNCCCSVFVPMLSHSHPLPLQETLQSWQVTLAQSVRRSLLFSLGPGVHQTLCAPSKNVVSISFSPMEFQQSNHWPSKPGCLRTPILTAKSPSLGRMTWGSGFSLLQKKFCGIIIFQFWVAHPVGVRFYFIMTAPLLISHCSLLFVGRVCFLVGSSFCCFCY